MNWFKRDTPDPKTAQGQVVEIKDIDLIAKLINDVVYIVDDQIYHKLAFADEEGLLYYAEYCGIFNDIEEGDIVKLRSICIIITPESRKVTFNNYSAVLKLNKGAVDHKRVQAATKKVKVDQKTLDNQEFLELHLDKMQKIQIGLNTFAFKSTEEGAVVSGAKLKKNLVRSIPTLNDYEHGDDDFLYENNFGFKFLSKRGSAVLTKYSNQTYYTFKELFQIQEEITMNPDAAKKYQHQKFLIRGFILATEYDYIFQTAKLYSPSLNKV